MQLIGTCLLVDVVEKFLPTQGIGEDGTENERHWYAPFPVFD
jgi:hypothetical protein